jgi:adenine phosphoribosyltransferase
MPSNDALSIDFRALIRDIPDFPKPGILFRDITPLLGSGVALRACIRQLCERVAPSRPQVVAGIESRGFIFGTAVASEMGIGFIPIRKPGKLPWKTRRESYALEYGSDAIEVHEDALATGTRVALVDDLLATGGTASAAVKLLRGLGAKISVAAFVVELSGLQGRARLPDVSIESLVTYP